jgi:hypothetical protein
MVVFSAENGLSIFIFHIIIYTPKRISNPNLTNQNQNPGKTKTTKKINTYQNNIKKILYRSMKVRTVQFIPTANPFFNYKKRME